jgi:hypothetical protein
VNDNYLKETSYWLETAENTKKASIKTVYLLHYFYCDEPWKPRERSRNKQKNHQQESNNTNDEDLSSEPEEEEEEELKKRPRDFSPDIFLLPSDADEGGSDEDGLFASHCFEKANQNRSAQVGVQESSNDFSKNSHGSNKRARERPIDSKEEEEELALLYQMALPLSEPMEGQDIFSSYKIFFHV